MIRYFPSQRKQMQMLTCACSSSILNSDLDWVRVVLRLWNLGNLLCMLCSSHILTFELDWEWVLRGSKIPHRQSSVCLRLFTNANEQLHKLYKYKYKYNYKCKGKSKVFKCKRTITHSVCTVHTVSQFICQVFCLLKSLNRFQGGGDYISQML